jgi:hypothetical protein
MKEKAHKQSNKEKYEKEKFDKKKKLGRKFENALDIFG